MHRYTFFTLLFIVNFVFIGTKAQAQKTISKIHTKPATTSKFVTPTPAKQINTQTSNGTKFKTLMGAKPTTKAEIFNEVSQKGTVLIDKQNKPFDLVLPAPIATIITQNKGMLDIVPIKGMPEYQNTASPNEASEAEKQALLAQIEVLYSSYKQNEQVQYYLDEDAFTPLRSWQYSGIWATREQINIANDLINKMNLSLKRNLDKNNINTVLDRWNALTQRSGIKPKNPMGVIYTIMSANTLSVTPYARDAYGTPIDNALMYLTPVNQMTNCSPCIDCTFDSYNCDLNSIQNNTSLTLVGSTATNIMPGKYHIFITQENNGIETVVGYARRNISQDGQLTITAQ